MHITLGNLFIVWENWGVQYAHWKIIVEIILIWPIFSELYKWAYGQTSGLSVFFSVHSIYFSIAKIAIIVTTLIYILI